MKMRAEGAAARLKKGTPVVSLLMIPSPMEFLGHKTRLSILVSLGRYRKQEISDVTRRC
jgi:hypothetical protein